MKGLVGRIKILVAVDVLKPGDLVRVPRVPGTLSNLARSGTVESLSLCGEFANVEIRYGPRTKVIPFRITDLQFSVDGRKMRRKGNCGQKISKHPSRVGD